MPNPDSFGRVADGLRAQNEEAAAEVFGRFVGRLIGLARSRLDSHIRQKIDAEDVVQSVFRSFFARQAEGQFQLEDWDGLWSLLVRIALCKCGEKARIYYAQRRDLGREVSPAGKLDRSHVQWEAFAREPTPEEAAALSETLDRLLCGLDERRQQILALRLQGYTVLEISEQLACTERTVYRVLGKVRDLLKQMDEDTPP